MSDYFDPCPRCGKQSCRCPSLDERPYLPGEQGYGQALTSAVPEPRYPVCPRCRYAGDLCQ